MELATLMTEGMKARTPGRPSLKAPHKAAAAIKAADTATYKQLLMDLGMADPLANLPLI